MFGETITIIQKEFRELCRDKRTLRVFGTIVLGLAVAPILVSFGRFSHQVGNGSDLFISGARDIGLLLFAALVAVVNIGVDITTGEIERGTIESTLNTRVSDFNLCLAKWLVIALCAFGAMIMVLLLSLIQHAIRVPLRERFGIDLATVQHLPQNRVQYSFLCLFVVHIASVFAAVSVVLGFYAKTMREAMGLHSLLAIAVLAPVAVNRFEIIPNALTGLIPVLGGALMVGWADLTALRVAYAIELTAATSGIVVLLVHWAKLRLRGDNSLSPI